MADSDDWENAVEDALDESKQADDKKAKFDDEDAVDSDEERKVKAKALKIQKAEDAAKPKVGKKDAKDYDKMFDERNKIKRPAATEQDAVNKLSAEEMSRRTEEDITEQLFATEVAVDANALRSEKDYINFAQQVDKVLYVGHAGYNIPAFFKELLSGIGKSSGTTADDLKKILDVCTTTYNTKVAEEKKKDGGNKKKAAGKAKPMIATGKQYERNNNPGMVSDLVGGENEKPYGEEDDYYGAEEEYKGREAENAYDFM